MNVRIRWLFCFLLLVGACGDERADGALYVTWKIGALTCEDADVMVVAAAVYGYEGTEPKVSAASPCQDKSLQMENVPPGDYTLVLQGLDRDECATHEVRREIVVPEGSVKRVPDLPLLRRQRDLLAHWFFENRLDCLGNGVHQVEIRVNVADLFEETYFSLCEGFQTPLRDKLPLGQLTMAVRGLDTDGNAIAYGRVTHERGIFLERPCADNVRVQVPLTMCDQIDCEDIML